MAEHSSTLLLDGIIKLFDNIQSAVMLTKQQTNEIYEAVYTAIMETEKVFGRKGGERRIIRNEEIADVWKKAGIAIKKYLPDENLGIWLINKGEAWANPSDGPQKPLKPISSDLKK